MTRVILAQTTGNSRFQADRGRGRGRSSAGSSSKIKLAGNTQQQWRENKQERLFAGLVSLSGGYLRTIYSWTFRKRVFSGRVFVLGFFSKIFIYFLNLNFFVILLIGFGKLLIFHLADACELCAKLIVNESVENSFFFGKIIIKLHLKKNIFYTFMIEFIDFRTHLM